MSLSGYELVMSEPALFSLSIEKLPGHCVVRPEGELDVAAVPEMETALDRALEQCSNVLIDLQDVTFMDSSGLRLLLGARQRCAAADGQLEVINPGEDVQRLLDLTGMSALLL